MKSESNNRETDLYVRVMLLGYALISLFTIIFFDGTGGNGDSVLHFLSAKYAPVHPEIYVYHWAKPVFVLLASPIAQAGFIGIKLFNAATSIFTLYLTWRVAVALNINRSDSVIPILIFTPLYYILTFSGLTEPLFALFTILSIYLLIIHRWTYAAILLSFLPFIRSEGLIIAGALSLYMIYQRKWSVIPLLVTGHLVYSVLGYFHYEDLLWVFRKTPYDLHGTVYGSGELFHFVEQLIYVTGIPIYILFWAGFLSLIKKDQRSRLVLLIFLPFLSFFIAHSLFWHLGIFNSLGLKRVLVGVIPLIAIISLSGLNFLSDLIPLRYSQFRRILHWTFMSYVIIFPFTSNPAAVDWNTDMYLSPDQVIGQKIAAELDATNTSGQRFFYSDPNISLSMNIDHFDSEKHTELTIPSLNHLRSGDIIIWENWFCPVEYGVTEEMVSSLEGLQKISEYSDELRGREIRYALFRVY